MRFYLSIQGLTTCWGFVVRIVGRFRPAHNLLPQILNLLPFHSSFGGPLLLQPRQCFLERINLPTYLPFWWRGGGQRGWRGRGWWGVGCGGWWRLL